MSARSFDPGETIAWMRNCFDVRPEDGELIWVQPPSNHPRLLGKAAGSPRPTHSGKRYVHIKMDRRPFKRGWLIFLFVHGRWPTECLDHIDGDSLNDRIVNLRDATVMQNAWNHHKRARRINLPMGVRLATKSGRYQARIGYNKQQLHLGTYDTPQEAEMVYLAKRKELFGEYA